MWPEWGCDEGSRLHSCKIHVARENISTNCNPLLSQHTHTHTHVLAHARTHTYTYTHIHMHARTRARTHTHTHTHSLSLSFFFSVCLCLSLSCMPMYTFSSCLCLPILSLLACLSACIVLLLLVGCLTSQQHASVSQGRICSDNFTCCHTEIEVADQTFCLTQSQYTDTGPTSLSADPTMPGAWLGSHWSANF